MDDPTLFMLCDPKKCKKPQNNMDAYMNSYQIYSNNLNEDEMENQILIMNLPKPKKC